MRVAQMKEIERGREQHEKNERTNEMWSSVEQETRFFRAGTHATHTHTHTETGTYVNYLQYMRERRKHFRMCPNALGLPQSFFVPAKLILFLGTNVRPYVRFHSVIASHTRARSRSLVLDAVSTMAMSTQGWQKVGTKTGRKKRVREAEGRQSMAWQVKARNVCVCVRTRNVTEIKYVVKFLEQHNLDNK